MGGHSQRSFSVVNRSAKVADVTLALARDAVGSDSAVVLAAVQLSPAQLTLRPRESADVEVEFAPKQRMAPFSHDVIVSVDGCSVGRFLRVGGAGHGVGMLLGSDTLSFGAVIRNSSLKKRVKLDNVGDVACSFAWDVTQ